METNTIAEAKNNLKHCVKKVLDVNFHGTNKLFVGYQYLFRACSPKIQ